MYEINEQHFFKVTGVEAYSAKGSYFRALAVTSLKAFLSDLEQSHQPNQILAHRLKGILSTCGLSEAAIVCKKIECYHEVMSQHKQSEILSDIVKNSIKALKG
ncbi:hypothetical protein ACGDLY_001255 [Vibrio campbellii]